METGIATLLSTTQTATLSLYAWRKTSVSAEAAPLQRGNVGIIGMTPNDAALSRTNVV